MDPEILSQRYDAQLENLLIEHGSGSYRLPLLKEEESWFKRYAEQFWEMIRSFIPDKLVDPQNLPQLDIELLLRMLGVLCIIVAVILAVYLLLQLRKGYLKSVGIPPSPVHEGEAHAALSLSSQLSEALRAADLKRARRLRWKIFLSDTGLGSDLTPLECSRKETFGFLYQHETTLIRGMFAAQNPTVEEYDAAAALLTQKGPVQT